VAPPADQGRSERQSAYREKSFESMAPQAEGLKKTSVFIHALNPTINIISATNLVASLQLGGYKQE